MGGNISLENRTERVIKVRVAVLNWSSLGKPGAVAEYDRVFLTMEPNQREEVDPSLVGRFSSSGRSNIAILLARVVGEEHMKDFGGFLRLSSYSKIFFHMDADGGGLKLSGIKKPRFWPFNFKCGMISNHYGDEGEREVTLISSGSICSVDAYPIRQRQRQRIAQQPPIYYLPPMYPAGVAVCPCPSC